MRRIHVFWVGATLFGLAIGLPLAWGFSHFHRSSEAHEQQSARTGGHDPQRAHDAAEGNKNGPAPRQGKHEKEHDWWGPEAWLVYVTFPLMVFTGLLFKSTRDMARDAKVGSAKALAASTEATNLARDEFNATHRPQIIVHSFELAHEYRGDEGEAISAEFIAVNKGTTDAVIEDISGLIFAARHLRPGANIQHLDYDGLVLASGESLQGIGIDGTPASAQAAEIEFAHGGGETPKQTLWCVGRITYADRQGRKRETGFCRRYDPEGHRWLQEPNSDYEYGY